MESSTTNGLKVEFVESKRDVAELKMMASILRQLEDLADSLESLRYSLDSFSESMDKILGKGELRETLGCDDEGEYDSFYFKKVCKRCDDSDVSLIKWIMDNCNEMDLMTQTAPEILGKYLRENSKPVEFDGNK